MLSEVSGSLEATVGNRVTTRLSFDPHSFLFFSVSFNQNLVFPGRDMLKTMQAYIGHCGPKPGRRLKNIFKFV